MRTLSGWQKISAALLFSIIPAASFAMTETTSPASPVEPIYETTNPFGGYFGLWGFDVSKNQSVAIRFTPTKDYSLAELKLWFMNNDFVGETRGKVTVSLRTDELVRDDKSIPSSTIIEQWVIQTTAYGWDPKEETATSLLNPVLKAGVNYWIVATSDDEPGYNAVWNISSDSYGIVSNTQPITGKWEPIGRDQTGAALSVIITGHSVQ